MNGRSRHGRFPADFVWGVATAAYQIEGAAAVDGRSPSIWDTFSRTGGVVEGHSGDVACDHYHRWREDLDLLQWLGVDAYRFSVAWPRVQPGGNGPAEPRGLAFYDRLVDGLLERGIQPWASLYHWDLPQAREDAGGWPERDTAYRFAEYAGIVHDVLGDRVAGWITMNEPWCVSLLGYAAGVHAPGRQEDAAAIRAVHHVHLAHGLAMDVLRARGVQGLGYAPNLYHVTAASDSEADRDAARRIDGLQNRLFLDPVLRGTYPADVVDDLAPVTDFSFVRDGDLELIAAPIDFLGVNYYSIYTVAAATGDPTRDATDPDAARTGAHGAERTPWVGSRNVVFRSSGKPLTAMGWEVDADGLRQVLVRVADEYDAPPIYVTENGAAYTDVLHDGDVEDEERIAYVGGHLEACAAAIAEGVDLRGYFLWSLMDNFEWSWGYTRRFGIVHVDYETQARTPKASARWYRELMAGD